MNKEKYVILTHSNTLGGTGVRITDIQIVGGDVIFTADHGSKLTLPLTTCVTGLMVSTLGDAVVLNYVQPWNAMPMVNSYGYGGAAPYATGMVANQPTATSLEAAVESNVVALFQHELTTRLIEPLRKTAREMTGPRPQAASSYGETVAATKAYNSATLFLRDIDGVSGQVSDVAFDDGVFTFSVMPDHQIKVQAEYLDTFSVEAHPATLAHAVALSSQPIFSLRVVVSIRDSLLSTFPTVAEQYYAFMKERITRI